MGHLANPALWQTVGLLIVSNCFMTYAWYGHLRNLGNRPLIVVILISWGIAFFEYCAQVPANRLGHQGNLELAQLKILQEVISLSVFVPFSLLFMHEPWRWNFVWAGLCLVGAVYFIFRG